MRNNLREQLAKEITRKQFLQYMGGVLLMVLGLNNIIALLSGKIEHATPKWSPNGGARQDGFGTRKFGI